MALAPTGFSNGDVAATVDDASQTAVISGTPGTAVTLIVVDANSEDAPPGGFYDLDPYEQNKAESVFYYNTTIEGDGDVDIPFSVTTTAAGPRTSSPLPMTPRERSSVSPVHRRTPCSSSLATLRRLPRRPCCTT